MEKEDCYYAICVGGFFTIISFILPSNIVNFLLPDNIVKKKILEIFYELYEIILYKTISMKIIFLFIGVLYIIIGVIFLTLQNKRKTKQTKEVLLGVRHDT